MLEVYSAGVQAAPIGAGFEFQPGSILAAYSTAPSVRGLRVWV